MAEIEALSSSSTEKETELLKVILAMAEFW